MRVNKYGESEVEVRDYTFLLVKKKSLTIYISNYKNMNTRFIDLNKSESLESLNEHERQRTRSEKGTEPERKRNERKCERESREREREMSAGVAVATSPA